MTNYEARDDEREALAEVLARAYSASPYRDAHLRGADAILAAGYRKHPEPEITEDDPAPGDVPGFEGTRDALGRLGL